MGRAWDSREGMHAHLVMSAGFPLYFSKKEPRPSAFMLLILAKTADAAHTRVEMQRTRGWRCSMHAGGDAAYIAAHTRVEMQHA